MLKYGKSSTVKGGDARAPKSQAAAARAESTEASGTYLINSACIRDAVSVCLAAVLLLPPVATTSVRVTLGWRPRKGPRQ